MERTTASALPPTFLAAMLARMAAETEALSTWATAAPRTLADLEQRALVAAQGRAKELGYEVMSLYNHVSGKEDLLDAMVDAVAAEIEGPSPAPDAICWLNESGLNSVSSRSSR